MTTETTPNDEHVICPKCINQFRAIPVQVQHMLIEAGYKPPFKPAPHVENEATARITTETILTDEEVQGILSRVYNYPLSQIHPTDIRAWRAIEQAVLQSPQMQAQQEDSDRYHALRQMNWFDSPLCVVVNPQKYLKLGTFCPSVGELDAAIDNEIEQQK